MQRYNMFNQIHKSLRVLLYDTAALIGRTDFDDPSQLDAVNERVKGVVIAFDKHDNLLKNNDYYLELYSSSYKTES